MRKIFTVLVLCALTFSASASVYYKANIVITNLPVVKAALSGGSDLRQVTNDVPVDATKFWQSTNTTQAATTNLYQHLIAHPFANQLAVKLGTNDAFSPTNTVVIELTPDNFVSFTSLSNWCSITYSTNTTAPWTAVRVPFTNETSNVQRKVRDGVIDIINDPNNTNKVSNTAPAFPSFITTRTTVQNVTNLNSWSGTNRPNDFIATNGALRNVSSSNMMATNLTGSSTNLMALKGTNDGTMLTNIPLAYCTQLVAQAATIWSGSATNMTNVNSPGGVFTNITQVGTAKLKSVIADGLTATNFSAPGTAIFSLRIGDSSTATGPYCIAIGQSADATNVTDIAIGNDTLAGGGSSIAIGDGATSTGDAGIAIGLEAVASGSRSMALGWESVSAYLFATAIGANAVTTEDHQVMLGSAAEHVTIPGDLRGAVLTNNTFKGTNQFNGEVSHLPRTFSTAISGYVTALNLGTNSYVRVTGASGAFTNASFKGGYAGLRVLVEWSNPGLSCTFLDHSSIGTPASTEKLSMGNAALANSTNNPVFTEWLHNGTEWNLLWIR